MLVVTKTLELKNTYCFLELSCSLCSAFGRLFWLLVLGATTAVFAVLDLVAGALAGAVDDGEEFDVEDDVENVVAAEGATASTKMHSSSTLVTLVRKTTSVSSGESSSSTIILSSLILQL